MAGVRPRKRKKTTRRFARLRWLASAPAFRSPVLWGCLALLALAQLESVVWVGALLAELRLFLLLLTLTAAALTFLRKQALLGTLLLGSALLWAAPLWPSLRRMHATPGHGPNLELVQEDAAHVALSARALASFLGEQNADIVSLTGLRPQDVTNARRWAAGYGALSATADAESAVLVRPALLRGAQRAAKDQVQVGPCTVQLTQLNLPSVFRPDAPTRRKALLEAFEASEGLPRRIYFGRFGSRAEAADLADFRRSTQARDVRIGHGRLATAPGALGPLGLPVDQIFVHGWLLVHETRVAPPMQPGMHRALVTRVELTERRCERRAR